jgi:hypothetical protein
MICPLKTKQKTIVKEKENESFSVNFLKRIFSQIPFCKRSILLRDVRSSNFDDLSESLILAQDERWRRA